MRALPWWRPFARSILRLLAVPMIFLALSAAEVRAQLPNPVLLSPSGPGQPTASISYTWQPVSGAVYYYLYVSRFGKKYFDAYLTANASLCPSNCTVTPGVGYTTGEYVWLVIAIGSTSQSGYNTKTFQVGYPPQQPTTLLSPTGTGVSQMPSYTWSPASDATAYLLVVVEGTSYVVVEYLDAATVCSGTTCSATPAVALAPGSHVWVVQPRNEVGGGPSNNPAGTFTVGAPQASPTPVSPTGLLDTDVPTYIWNTVPGATEYDFTIYYDTAGNPSNPQWQGAVYETLTPRFECDATACRLTRHWVHAPGYYFWAARARNSLSTGPWSALQYYTVPQIDPTPLSSHSINAATVWTKSQSPYVVDGVVTVNALLSIEPGVQVRFATNSYLSVWGELRAQGTPEDPIVFTSSQPLSPAGGAWRGLRFENASSPSSLIENAFIGYAGGGTAPLTAVLVNGASPTLRDVTILASGGDGVYTSGSYAKPVFDGVVIREVATFPIEVAGGGFDLIDAALAENGGAYAMKLPAGTVWSAAGEHFLDQPVQLVPGNVVDEVTWWNLGTPFVSPNAIDVASSTTNAVLTIEPGVEVRFGTSGTSAGRLTIGAQSSPGTLVARGTATEPIVFTSNQPTPLAGQWERVEFLQGAMSASVLDHAVVEYGGMSPTNGAIRVFGSSPTITNTVVRESAGNGIFASNGAAPLLQGNHYEAIAATALYSNALPTPLDARGSYWSDPNGPNQGGEGYVSVNQNEPLFQPWLEAPVNLGLTASQSSLTKPSFNKTLDHTAMAAELSSPSGWVLDVVDVNDPNPATQIKRKFVSFGSTVNVTWDGAQTGGGQVPDGTYRLRLTATEGATYEAMAPLVADVTVTGGATNAPVAVLSSPPPGAVRGKGAILPITGTATDPDDFVSYTLEYGAGLTPSSWNFLATGTSPVSGGELSQWDTSGVTGSSSTYSLRLTTTSASDPPATDQIAVSFLEIESFGATNAVFSPTASSSKKTTTFTGALSLPATWTLTLKSSGGTTVRTFTGTGTALSTVWDGKDSGGATVADGTYTYFLDVLHVGSGTAVSATPGTVVVDKAGPTAVITSPLASATVSNVVPVIGTATDAVDFDYYRLDYTIQGGLTYRLIFHAASGNPNPPPVVNGLLADWTTNDETERLPLELGSGNGAYDVRLQVYDKAGNMAEQKITVNVANLYVTDVSRDTPVIDPTSLETATVYFSLSETADVTLSWAPEFPPASAPVRSDNLGTLSGGVVHSFVFDGKDDLGVPLRDEAYVYLIQATTPAGLTDEFREFYYNKYTNPTPKYVELTDLDYSPLNNDVIRQSFTLSSGPARGSFRVEYKDSGGATYQVFPQRDALFSNGTNEVFWDGRGPSGAVATDVTEVNYLISGFELGCNPCSVADQTLFYGIQNNYVEIQGTVPRILPGSVSADPYVLVLTYAQVVRFEYELSMDANVTVVVTDPNGNHVKTVVLQEPQFAGVNQVVWDGSNEAGGAPQQEGNYTFTITATHPQTGHSASAKGNLIVRR